MKKAVPHLSPFSSEFSLGAWLSSSAYESAHSNGNIDHSKVSLSQAKFHDSFYALDQLAFVAGRETEKKASAQSVPTSVLSSFLLPGWQGHGLCSTAYYALLGPLKQLQWDLHQHFSQGQLSAKHWKELYQSYQRFN